jgi:hypothetical protein
MMTSSRSALRSSTTLTFRLAGGGDLLRRVLVGRGDEGEPKLRHLGQGRRSGAQKLAHGGNPVTGPMAANVAVAQDPAGNLKPAKDKSTERIDASSPLSSPHQVLRGHGPVEVVRQRDRQHALGAIVLGAPGGPLQLHLRHQQETTIVKLCPMR